MGAPPKRRWRTPRGDRTCDRILFALSVQHGTYSSLARRLNMRPGAIGSANQANRARGFVTSTKLLKTDREQTWFITDAGSEELASIISGNPRP